MTGKLHQVLFDREYQQLSMTMFCSLRYLLCRVLTYMFKGWARFQQEFLLAAPNKYLASKKTHTHFAKPSAQLWAKTGTGGLRGLGLFARGSR